MAEEKEAVIEKERTEIVEIEETGIIETTNVDIRAQERARDMMIEQKVTFD